MSTTIYLVGEGLNDIGHLAREPEYQDGDEGFFQPVIRRIADRETLFRGTQLKTLGRDKVRGLSDIFSRRARQARALAEYERADVVVLATDVDTTQGKSSTNHEAAKRMEALRDAILAGFESVDGPPAVIATPCRTIEAWALGDVSAVGTVLGTTVAPLPKPPEELWGKPNDPQSNHPKCVLHRLFGGQLATNHYAEIATLADLDVLEQMCPLSFLPFADGLREILGSD